MTTPPASQNPWAAPSQPPPSQPPPAQPASAWTAPAPPPPPVAVPTPQMPPPQPYGWGPTPTPRRTNTLAIVSLVTSLLCLVPVAVVTGIIALVQVRRRNESGQGLAIAGLSVSAVATVVAAGIFATSMFLPDFFSDTYHRGTSADVEGLVIGDCFSETGSGAAAVDCADEHDGEIYFVGPVVADSVDEAQLEADDACYEEFEPYVGKDYDLSDFDYVFYAPDDDSWKQGDREFACAIVPMYTDALQGSARGSGD